MTVTIGSACAHCAQPLALRIDSELTFRVPPAAAAALVFVPLVNFAKLKARHIIDDF